jgi:hypothetical protein
VVSCGIILLCFYEGKQNYGTAQEFWEGFQGESGN